MQVTPEQMAEKLKRDAEFADIYEAYAAGKVIEYNVNGQWYDEGSYSFDVERNRYRIRPERKLRPLNPDELRALVGKSVSDKATKNTYAVACWDHKHPHVVFVTLLGRIGSVPLLSDYEHLDGSPLGVWEEVN